MNLGELIVNLSLDYTEFSQSLEKAKKAAANAASSIEKSFDKVSLTIEVDDSALYDLNKHLDLKYKHFKEVNNYFKNNPLTPTVDDEQLTQLNETLQELTRSNHVINVQQNLDIKVTDESKREISQTVANAIEEGVLNAIDKVAGKIEDAIANAVSKGTGSASAGSGAGIKDAIEEIKSGFKGISDATGNSQLDQAIGIVLKPGKDLITGLFEGISTGFGIELSKGMQKSLKKNSDVDMNDVGEKAADGFLKAFGVKIKSKKGKKSGVQDFGEEIIKDAVKSVASGSIENIIATGVKVAVESAKNAVTTELIPIVPIASPPARQKRRRQELEPVPVNIPQLRQQELEPVPVNIPQQTQQRVGRIAVDSPELKTPFAKAQEQSRDFSYSLEDVVKSKFTGANLKELTEKITKIKTTHQALHKTLLNLMEKARTSGDFRAIEAIYLGYQTDGKKAIDEINRLMKEMAKAGATQDQINSISQAKSPITRAMGRSGKLFKTYQKSKVEAEKAEFVGDAAVGIGLDVIAGLKEGTGKGQFAKLATENALAYLAAIKKTFGIQSPSKVMMEVGLNIIQGLQQGLNGNVGQVTQSAIGIKDQIIKAFSGKGFDFKGIFNSLKNLDFAAIGLNLIQSFVKRFSDGKGLFSKVISAFSSIIPLIKKVFGIASPSRVMQEIGLDFGKGFEDGAVASLVLANKKIADLIAKSPNLTNEQRKNVLPYIQRVDAENARIASQIRSGELTPQQASHKLSDTTISGFIVNRKFKLGIDENLIRQQLQQARREVKSVQQLSPQELAVIDAEAKRSQVKTSAPTKASPHAVMKDIGLDFGKGFEDGAVASLVLANKKIADLIAKNISKNPDLTDAQREAGLRYARNVYDQNKQIANAVRSGEYTTKQASLELDKTTREGLKVARVSGIEDKTIKQLREQARREVKSVQQLSPQELAVINAEIARQGKKDLSVMSETQRNRELLREETKQQAILAAAQSKKMAAEAKQQNLTALEQGRQARVAREAQLAADVAANRFRQPIADPWNTPEGHGVTIFPRVSKQRSFVPPKLFNPTEMAELARQKQIQILEANKAVRNTKDDQPIAPTPITQKALNEVMNNVGSGKTLLKNLFDSIVYGAKQASQTGDNSLGDYLKNFTITFVEDFLKKQKVTGGKGDAIKDILGAAFGGNKPALMGTLLKGFLGVNPLAPVVQRITNIIPTILGEAIKNRGVGDMFKMSLPLLAPVAGLVATKAGGFVSDAITNNNAIKPGLINDLINSLTGINLAKPTQKLPEILGTVLRTFTTGGILGGGQLPILKPLGAVSSALNTLLFGKQFLDESTVTSSGKARVSPGEVIRNQIATNINSLGIAPGEGIKGLVTQVGKTLVDSLTFKNTNLSVQMKGVVEKNKNIIDGIVNGAISGILNLSIFTNKQSGILGKVIGAADAYGSGNVQGAISKGTAAVKGITQIIGLKIDTSQIKIAMTALLLGISAFHKAFTEEGLNIGKALIKGFKEAQSNWISARNDVRRGIQKAIGAESLKDTWNDIAHEWGKGVVSVARFEELFDVMGKTFRKRMLSFMNPEDREGMQGNILSFVASISTAFAPVATFATSLIPLFAPLLPLFGAIGGAALMVGKHIQGIATAIKEVEPLQRRLEFLGGSKEGGRQEMAYALGTADRLNVPVKEGVQAYSQLAIAARHTKLEGDGVRELYEGISASLSALGISGADAGLVFMAYTQILAKGKVSMEELRQQLGEKFPPAMGVFAKALGVSIAELGALVSKGALLSEDVLPKVAKVLNQDYGNAAQGAQGLTIALTRLGNAGFKIAIKLTESFGGMFAGVVNMAASALGVFEKAMDDLLKLAGSLVIGVTAVIGVGLTMILRAPAINKHIMNISGLFTAGMKKLLVGLAPYYLGIITDVADGWLGAQQDLISNMYQGVGNVFVAILGFLDTQKRLLSDTGKGMFGEMVGELDAIRGLGELIGIVFQKITTPVVAFFQSIPSGLVEIGAMVLMFRQVQVLGQAFLGPTLMGAFKGLAQIAGNFGAMVQSAFTKNSIKDLFGGTFGAIDIASTFSPPSAQPSLASQLKQEFSELGEQVKSFGKEKWSNFRAGIDSARQSISNLSWQGFKNNIKNAADSVRNFSGNVWQGFTTGITRAKDAVASALTPFTALFSPNGAIRSAARADWANTWQGFKDNIKNAADSVKNFSGNVWQRFRDNIKNAADSVRNFSGNVWQGFTTGITRAKDAVASAISPFTSLFSRDSAIRTAARENAIANISNMWQGFTSGLSKAKDAVASALTPFTALFSPNGAVRSAARADWANAIAAGFGKVQMALAALKPLLIEVGIALALFMLSRSDFSNPVQGSINKMASSMNDALRSIDKSFASLGEGLDKTSKKIQNLTTNLPSKGLELNIKYAIGLGGESFKTDDLAKLANEGGGIQGNLARFAADAFKGGLQNLNPIHNLGTLASIFGYRRTDPNAERLKEDAEKFGLAGLFTGNENSIELSKSQLLAQFKSLEGNTAAFREQLTSRGLTRATVGNLMQGDTLETVKQVRQVEKELYELGKKRAELGLQNTSESRNKISELDKQLFALEDKRAKLVKPLLAVDEDVKSFQKSVEDMAKAIEESNNPPDVKRKLRAMLEPMQEMAKEASEIVAENLPVKPLEDVYQNTINALKDFELAYERFGRDLEKASLGRQEALFTSGATPGQVQFGNREGQIEDETIRLNALRESVEISRKSLTNLLSIPGIERTGERADEIKELRKKIQEGELGVKQLSTSIARNRYELQQELVRQTKQVADYYRGAVREAEFVGLEFEKASRNLKNTQLQTKLKQALIGAGDNLYTQFIENIINVIQQTSRDVENARIDAQRQQLEYRNNVEDIQLQAADLARSLPGEIIPFDQSVVIDFDNALKNIDGTVNTINSSVGKVEKSLGVDIVEAAKKANDALRSIDRKIAEIESSSKQWTNSLTSGFNSFINNFKNGWQGVGQAIADVTGQSTNLITTLSSGTGIVGAIATGIQAANQGQFGSGVQQEVQSAAPNPLGWLKSKAEASIVSFVENSRSSEAHWGGHIGDDIFAPIGSKIFAPASGTVVQSREGGTRNTDDANPLVPGYQPQQLVVIKLDMPIEFAGKKITHLNMRHLLDRNVKVGQKVNIGDLIGTVGEAGGRGTQFGTKKPGTPADADAAHLHIEYATAENNQRTSLPDALASKLTAQLSKSFIAAAQGGIAQQSPQQTRPQQTRPQPTKAEAQQFQDLVNQSFQNQANQEKPVEQRNLWQRFTSWLMPSANAATPRQAPANPPIDPRNANNPYHPDFRRNLEQRMTQPVQTSVPAQTQTQMQTQVQTQAQTQAPQQTRQYKPVQKAPTLPGGVLWGQAANYAPSDLSGLTTRGKKAVEALRNPNVRAFLDAIAVAEVGVKGAAQGGYGYLIGDDVRGKQSFDPNNLNTHPGKRIRYGRGKNQVSSATGRYQTMDFVWKEEAGRLGLKDFKPQSQEILAVSRLMYRGILDEIMRGDFKSVINRPGNLDASSEWASLAGNPYGQGSPTGKLNVFFGNIQRNLQNLNQTAMQGRSIAPNQMQQAVTQGAQIRMNTAAQQLQVNQTNSGTSQANLALRETEKFLQIYKTINSQRSANFNEARRLSEADLSFRQKLVNLLNPNQSDRQKFSQELARLRQDLDNMIADAEKTIADKALTLAKAPDLNAIFEETLKSTGRQDLAEQARQQAKTSFDLTKKDYEQATQQLAELKKQRDNIINTAIGNFDRREQFRLDEQALRITDAQIEQLQKQLDLAKQLEQSNPLDPVVKNIPEIERNLANLNLQKEAMSRLIQLDREFYEGGGNLSREMYEQLRDNILRANESQQELNRSTFDYNKLIKELDYESKQLAKTQLLMSSRMKALQLENDAFAINNRNGLININGLTNELTIKVNELTNAYKQQNLETRNLSNGLTEQERLIKQLRDSRNYQLERQNLEKQNEFDRKMAELVTNPRVLLEGRIKREDLINTSLRDIRSSRIDLLRDSNANQFLTNRMSRELEIERELERVSRAKEQFLIDIKEFNLMNPDMAFAADEIERITKAMDDLSQVNLDKINGQFKTFGQAIEQVVREQKINGLTSGIADLIMGTKSLGDVLNDLANNILNGVLNLALNSLFSGIFGGGGLLGGGRNGFLGGIFGFNKGGVVPNFAEGGVIGAIGDALHRERMSSGRQPVLAALTPGERVLTVQQNKRFEELQLEKVLNYSQGGVVGNAPKMSMTAPAQSSNININVPVNVQGNQNDASVNVPQLQNAVRSAVLSEIQKQQRPGGALNR